MDEDFEMDMEDFGFPTPLEILQEQFHNGDITEEEFYNLTSALFADLD